MAKNDDDRDHEVGRKAAEIEAAAREAQRYRRMDYWRPYPKQREFFATGLRYRERGLFAGTQLGKTESAAYEMACHLTGLYAPDWPGRKFTKPIKAWAVGESLKMCRDIMQKKLCGEPGDVEAFGSGMIPKHLLPVDGVVMARGEGNAYDTIQVRHKSGGVSTLRFRTYSAGRTALQGETLDFIWLDEEPDDFEVYSECLARISATGGCLIVTFTPLRGMSGISIRYRQEHSPDRTFVQMGIDDVPPAEGDSGSGSDDVPPGHLPLADRARIIEGFPAHEREARSRGEPMLGEGRVYATPESGASGGIVEDEDHLSWPSYWPWGWGMDPGAGHPFGAALCCFDNDQKIMHIVAEVRMSDATIAQHVTSMRQIEKSLFNSLGMEIPVAWPADTGVRDRQTMQPLTKLYAQYGLKMMMEPASLPGITGQAKFSLEGGVAEIDAWERAGKWKVHRRCLAYLEERRLYHRKDGEIVRLRDDVLAAARYAFMNRRYFKPLDVCRGVPNAVLGPGGRRQLDPRVRYARGSSMNPAPDYDIFNV